MKAFLHFAALATLSILLFTGCEKDEEDITPVYFESVTEYTSPYSLTAENIQSHFIAAGQSDLAPLSTNDIKIYKIKYKTGFEGDSITVSALVAIPDNKKNEFPIMSYQHGVLTSNANAPTVNPQDQITTLASFVASTGMIVTIPDYIGYGSSSNYNHPFMHKEYLANAVIDGVKATKEFIATAKPCKTNNNVFLYGFGEGATATLAALSKIENDPINEIKVKGAACSSGVYNLIRLREWIMSQQKYYQPWYLAYLLSSYNEYNDVDISNSLVFETAYSDLIDGLVDGTRTSTEMNDILGTKSVNELLNDNFIDNDTFSTNTEYSKLKTALENNSVPAWALKTNLSLYYGKDDSWIPADQSLILYNEFKSAGATTNIKINAMEGLDHEGSIIPSMAKATIWFKSL